MGRSLSLAAYRAYTRRKLQAFAQPSAARPEGELLWAHATSATRFSALCDLGARLRFQRPGLQVLITVEEARFGPRPPPTEGCDRVENLGSDHPGAARRFLNHWAPDICLWAGGDLMPNLIEATSDQNIPMILLDVGDAYFPTRHHKWFPDLTRSSLMKFDVIFTTSQSAADMIQRIGVTKDKITTTSRLRNSATPMPWPEHELAAVTDDLASRPVWLAAFAQPSEFDAILNAHRRALRLFHRLLLVIVAADADGAEELEQILARSRLRYADWNNGAIIEDNTQVLIAGGTEDVGLWYRVAPLTFMASSLSPGAAGQSPLEAAALGTAVLYGPNVGNHGEEYARLSAAGAARNVGDGAGLGASVVQLVAPDQAAAMALAGWEVVTEAAHLTDKLVDLAQDMLDLREAANAAT